MAESFNGVKKVQNRCLLELLCPTEKLIDGRLSSEGVVGEECIFCASNFRNETQGLHGSTRLNAMKKHEPEGSRDSPSPKSIVETLLCMSPDLFPTNYLGLAPGPSKRAALRVRRAPLPPRRPHKSCRSGGRGLRPAPCGVRQRRPHPEGPGRVRSARRPRCALTPKVWDLGTGECLQILRGGDEVH